MSKQATKWLEDNPLIIYDGATEAQVYNYAESAYDAGRDSMMEAPPTPFDDYVISRSSTVWTVWWTEENGEDFKSLEEANAAIEEDWKERWDELMKMKEEQT